MALHGKTSEWDITHDDPVPEIHKRNRKAMRRRRAVNWLPLPMANESASVATPKKKK